MRILALDIARVMGVAVGEHTGAPTCYTYTLGSAQSTHAYRCGEAARTTNMLIKKHKPDAVAIEACYINQRDPKKIRAAIMLLKLHGAVLGICHVHGLHPQEYTVQECRKHFISAGTLNRATAKATVMNTCELLGWEVENDNEADAAAVWEFHRAKEKLASIGVGMFLGS